MQKLSEATQQKLADANAVAEADASWVGIWDGQLQLDEIYDPRHPDVWDFRKTLDILMYLVPNLYDTRDGHKKTLTTLDGQNTVILWDTVTSKASG